MGVTVAAARSLPASGSTERAAHAPLAHTGALALATLCYLIVELAFAARLLDVTGGNASPDEIVSVARWGRLISGIALTLAIWGSLVLPRAAASGWGSGRTITALTLSFALCVSGAWVAEKALVDHMVAASDGATRRAAAQLRVLSVAILDGSARISGIDLSPEALARPEGKAFLAIFPFIALSGEGATRSQGDIVRRIHRAVAQRRYGTAEQVFNGVFIPSVRSVRDAYGRYVAAQRRLADAVGAIPPAAERAWSEHVSARRGSARRGGVSAVEEARELGAPVADGWSPQDRRGFVAAFAAARRLEADAGYDADITSILGRSLPPGLDWDAFTATEEVQSRWRASIGADQAATLSSSMGFSAFRDLVYEPALERAVRREAEPLVGAEIAWEDGGPLEAAGRAAVKWLVVPPMVLALSLLGAMVHMFKAANLVLALLAPSLQRRGTMVLVGTLVLASAAFLAPNAITESDAFSHFESTTAERYGPGAAVASRWILQAEPFFHPVGDVARRWLLIGFDFEWGNEPVAPPSPPPAPSPWQGPGGGR